MAHVHCTMDPPLALVVLDRPQALNALDHGMIVDLRAALARARSDDRVRAVVLSGAGGRAFCAGGDVRSVVLDGRARGSLSRTFFRDEYRLNHEIAELARDKPWVSLWDGIVMGGGAGISVHGSHRVATERALFAMPETAIGFFPDVGASFFLPRCPGFVGTWLGLTGARIGAADLLAAGLATHVVESAALPTLVAALAHGLAGAQRDAHGIVDDVLAMHARAMEPVLLTAAHRGVIDRCFSLARMRDMIEALARETGGDEAHEPHEPHETHESRAFARDALSTLRAMSPTSLVATLALLRSGGSRTLTECLVAEYRASQVLTHGGDFDEGVRAALIDKDKAPRWRPARVEDVDDTAVHAAIAQVPEVDLSP